MAQRTYSARYEFLSKMRRIQGNLSNDVSYVATLMAKRYLAEGFDIEHFDAAEKPQGAPGIDIDVRTRDGQRIVAEIKTTMPYRTSDFGAQQAAMIKRDLDKLNAAPAQVKFLFVTESPTFAILRRPKYAQALAATRMVLLPAGDEYP